jgi:hypothetical protein
MGIRTPFEGSAILFRGCGARAVLEWVVQCRTVPYGGGDGLTGRVGGTAPGYDSQACQRRGMDSSLTRVPAGVRILNAPVGGAGAGAAGP